jgi:hypothetical protein
MARKMRKSKGSSEARRLGQTYADPDPLMRTRASLLPKKKSLVRRNTGRKK